MARFAACGLTSRLILLTGMKNSGCFVTISLVHWLKLLFIYLPKTRYMRSCFVFIFIFFGCELLFILFDMRTCWAGFNLMHFTHISCCVSWFLFEPNFITIQYVFYFVLLYLKYFDWFLQECPNWIPVTSLTQYFS